MGSETRQAERPRLRLGLGGPGLTPSHTPPVADGVQPGPEGGSGEGAEPAPWRETFFAFPPRPGPLGTHLHSELLASPFKGVVMSVWQLGDRGVGSSASCHGHPLQPGCGWLCCGGRGGVGWAGVGCAGRRVRGAVLVECLASRLFPRAVGGRSGQRTCGLRSSSSTQQPRAGAARQVCGPFASPNPSCQPWRAGPQGPSLGGGRTGSQRRDPSAAPVAAGRLSCRSCRSDRRVWFGEENTPPCPLTDRCCVQGQPHRTRRAAVRERARVCALRRARPCDPWCRTDRTAPSQAAARGDRRRADPASAGAPGPVPRAQTPVRKRVGSGGGRPSPTAQVLAGQPVTSEVSDPRGLH